MAVESLKSGLYTIASDVWSFGVTLWEIFSLGKTPFSALKNDLVVMHVLGGFRLPMPRYSSKAIFNTMQRCWKEDPLHRPPFIQLRQELLDLSGRYMNVFESGSEHDPELQFAGDILINAQGKFVESNGPQSVILEVGFYVLLSYLSFFFS